MVTSAGSYSATAPLHPGSGSCRWSPSGRQQGWFTLTDGQQCIAEQRVHRWRHSSHDHGHQFRLGSDGDFWDAAATNVV